MVCSNLVYNSLRSRRFFGGGCGPGSIYQLYPSLEVKNYCLDCVTNQVKRFEKENDVTKLLFLVTNSSVVVLRYVQPSIFFAKK